MTGNDCPYCMADEVDLNGQTEEYSGIEITFFPKFHYIRVRSGFDDPSSESMQDSININCCPMCGRALK